MQKKIEILNSIKPVSTIKISSKSKKLISFEISQIATEPFGTYFLDRVMSPKGLATVIGVSNGYIWFWIDGESGPTYWDNIYENIFSSDGFSKSQDTNYPPEVKNALNEALGLDIPFDRISSLDLMTLLKGAGQYTTEYLTNFLQTFLQEKPEEFIKQLELLIQEFEKLSISDFDVLAEFAELEKDPKPQLLSFIQGTQINEITNGQVTTLKKIVNELQAEIEMLENSMKLLKPDGQSSLHNMLSTLKQNLEISQKDLIKAIQNLNPVDSKVTHLKKISPYKKFNILLKALIEAYYGRQITHPDSLSLKCYLEGAAIMTQFLYDQGHQFFDIEGEVTNNNNKQEKSESLSRLEIMYLFLLLSGSGATSPTLQARVYLKIFEALGITPNDNEHMPETFNLMHFISNKPDDFIKIYRYFFLTEGPCKQKAEELIDKKNSVFLSELGKLTCHYAMALKIKAMRPDAKPGARQEVSYYLRRGVNYLLQAVKQRMPEAVETLDALCSQNDTDKNIENMIEVAKELASYYSNTGNFSKAHHYLDIASGIRNKEIQGLQKELQVLQVKTMILEHTGEKQKEAIETLMQLVRTNDQAAFDVFEELIMKVPAVALAAVVYWHDKDITKLSPLLLKFAAIENSNLVAWYQNQYQVKCKGKNSDLSSVLCAAKVGFPPAIDELNQLLISSPSYADDNQQTLLPIIRNFEISQYIAPEHLTTLLLHYHSKQDLSKEALNKFVESLAHTFFKKSESYFHLLFLILRDLRTLIGSDELIAVLFAIKRTGLLSPEHHSLLRTLATLFIERAATDDKSLFHSFTLEFLPNYPQLAQALYNDSEAWNILKNNEQIARLIKDVITDKKNPKEESSLINLSIFKGNNKEELAKTSKEEVEISKESDSKGVQKRFV
ncbi:hypothetical protein [Legionella sp. PC997]|uniref:hypothetical protein n=1 Tax=Legionella sp. PC997 TaxID=2755562 RepID=UPI0015FB20CE|nr:hypothetical protein [Legionella sp. PC997]QMT59154.1 hypothetical protein HBNCFIEN_00515 [Legionella sp. PC997]